MEPKSGLLEPFGHTGTEFKIGFKPVEYGKRKDVKLYIETEYMIWYKQIINNQGHINFVDFSLNILPLKENHLKLITDQMFRRFRIPQRIISLKTFKKIQRVLLNRSPSKSINDLVII